MNRRKALAGLSALVTASVAGCMSAIGEEEDVDGQPHPTISDVSVEVANFQATGDTERSLVIVENEGGEGEFKLTAESWTDTVPVESADQTFSMEAGQSFQTGFELVSNNNIQMMKFTFEATATGEIDEKTVEMGSDPDLITQ